MATLQDKLIERIDQLLSKAEVVRKTDTPNPPGRSSFPTLSDEEFFEWKVGVENLIIRVVGKDSHYHENFLNLVRQGYTSHLSVGIGILKALKEDLELGFLDQIKDLVLTEIFTDFLDMTQHLLEAGYKDPAASLIGAVLEDGLRKISAKNSLPVKSNDDIGSLNTKLADAKVYNRFTQRQIQAWKAIRDSAVHGKFDDYTLEDVKAMMEGVGRFLSENL